MIMAAIGRRRPLADANSSEQFDARMPSGHLHSHRYAALGEYHGDGADAWISAAGSTRLSSGKPPALHAAGSDDL